MGATSAEWLCAIAASIALASGCAQSTLRVRNMTAGTNFCRITAGSGPGSEFQVTSIPAGQSGEVRFSPGQRQVCVYACQQAVSANKSTTDVVGCQDLDLAPQTPEEIAVFDGPTKPDLANTSGTHQVAWENNLDPSFAQYRDKNYLTAYGQMVKGDFHATIDHPGACSKTVHVQLEDRKGIKERFPVDPKQKEDVVKHTPPIWLSIDFDPGLRHFRRIYDLPTGSYTLRVRDDCKGLDLVEEHYPDGAAEKAKAVPDEQRQ